MENRVQQAQRRVVEIESHIADMRQLIVYKKSLAQDTAELEKLLEIVEHSLALAQQRVEIEKKVAESRGGLADGDPGGRRSDRARGSSPPVDC